MEESKSQKTDLESLCFHSKSCCNAHYSRRIFAVEVLNLYLEAADPNFQYEFQRDVVTIIGALHSNK